MRKRIDDYEILGSIFRALKAQILENTLIEKIWFIFIQIYHTFLADLGVEWELFVRKLIESQEELNDNIKKALESIKSLNRRPI